MAYNIQRSLYLCCYDISNEDDRRLIRDIVKSYASGGQYSAYECFLSHKERHLLEALCKKYVGKYDSVVLQPLGHAHNIRIMGKASKPINSGFSYFG